MESALQAEPFAPIEAGGEDVANYYYSRVTMKAWRSRSSHALHVDIHVGASVYPHMKVTEGSGVAADVFVLKLIPAGEKSQPGECFLPFEKKNAPADRYVVVMDEATVLAVASIIDVP